MNNIKLDKDNMPSHLAIIMDGNGRWAKQKGKIRSFGHKFGAKTVKDIIRAVNDLNIKHLTLYAFSTENWKRPKEAVSYTHLDVYKRQTHVRADILETAK